ncbi:lipase family protein [Crateriforma conspicua]|uniref:Lipase (Class 3) n=1 Tax=Crateriforma conspicua TaxID=2527996 RepID=A0A5C5Y4Q0_9PLAN|nr:lipase family protein [Crateriforma conspicua]QDV64737.1 Lipase (class 3) [Crateriforma conspicua]TWT70134.1 Lipase (class 3) [Crateriforma conspicua]
MTKIVHDKGEVPVVIHSNVKGPIGEMTFMQRSLLFAELSMVAYNDPEEASVAASMAGFPESNLYDNDGSQAYRFRNEHDCVIACRGTEPNEWNDIRADANAASVLAETVGKVHRGFKREVDDLWPMLEAALISNDQPLWFCGHSLGGAMATICAGRCYLSHIASMPEQLYTFGSPRVGNKRYVNYVSLDHYRYVNNNDIVTRVPPAWMGYRHNGHEVYINRHGEIGELGMVKKRHDRWRGFVQSLTRWKIDHLSDHAIHEYIAALVAAVEEERAASKLGESPVQADDVAGEAPAPPTSPPDESDRPVGQQSGGQTTGASAGA